MKIVLVCAIAVATLISNNSFAKDVSVQQLNTPFVGSTLFIPNDGKPHSGIIMLHGSEGGSLPYARMEAQFLASNGYAVLAFCWYNCAKNPITSPIEPLENVEVRNIIRATEWLKNSTHVQGHKIAALGWSRGGELGVLLGSLQDSISLIDAIAVHTPSDTIVSGFGWAGMDKRCWVCTSFGLECFKSSEDPRQWDWANIKWNPSCGPFPKMPDQMQSWLLDGTPLKIGSVIEIEKLKKPVFITVGDKDEMWDYKKSIRIKERLDNSKLPVELHVFPGEFHNFSNAGENNRHQLLINFLERVL